MCHYCARVGHKSILQVIIFFIAALYRETMLEKISLLIPPEIRIYYELLV